MTYHPLLFTFWDAIAGNGFLAGIKLSGRAVIVEEEPCEWWMYGVCPAAIAETGATPEEAYFRFRDRYKKVLFDIAEEVGSFDGFKRETERFFYEADPEQEQQWNAAIEALRSGSTKVESPFTDLPRKRPEDHPSEVIVERFDDSSKELTPSVNIPDTYARAA